MKIAWLAGVLISLWAIAWSPYALVALIGIFGGKSVLTPLVSAVPALFCKTASCINPFVYAINHPRFQRELRSRFSMCYRYSHNKRMRTRQTSTYSAVTCRDIENSLPAMIAGNIEAKLSLKRKYPLVNSKKMKAESDLVKQQSVMELQIPHILVSSPVTNGKIQEAMKYSSDSNSQSQEDGRDMVVTAAVASNKVILTDLRLSYQQKFDEVGQGIPLQFQNCNLEKVTERQRPKQNTDLSKNGVCTTACDRE